jgi:F5/8 type C domain
MKVTILVLVCSLASTLLCLAQTGTPVIGGDYGGGMVFDIKEVKTSTTCKKEIYICSKMDDPKQYKYHAEHGQLTKDFNNDPQRNVGFKDWYIPSNNELTALYENLHKKGWGGFNQIEYASNNLFRIVFKTGEKFGSLNPIHSYSTRMVRKVTENCSGAALPTNVAKGKTAKQSSPGVYDGPAARAVDGNTSGDWSANSVTHTDDESNPWWEVDLGKVYNISEIKIWNRTDCCWGRLQNFYVMLSDNPIMANSTTANQFTSGPLSFSSATETNKSLKSNATGRYVRIFIVATGAAEHLSLAEVQVMGF